MFPKSLREAPETTSDGALHAVQVSSSCAARRVFLPASSAHEYARSNNFTPRALVWYKVAPALRSAHSMSEVLASCILPDSTRPAVWGHLWFD